MKILVTGASGFLGSALIAALLNRGERDIRCVVRRESAGGGLKALAALYPHADIELLVGDLVRREDAERVTKNVGVVYHLAAAMRGAPADMFLNTVVGSKHLLESLCNGPLARLILVSSFSVYGTGALRRGSVVDEETPLETHPEKRDVYSHTKLRQEQLFWDYRRRCGLPMVVARPGVVYGFGGVELPSRIGLNVFGVFLHMGGRNLLPLTYVDNCAEALVCIGSHPDVEGRAFNVVDDDLPTALNYLKAYRREVRRMRYASIPYFAVRAIAKSVERYHTFSHGQLPAVITPYKAACLWKGNRFDNTALKAIGWKPRISTQDGMHRTFSRLREELTSRNGR